VTPTLVSFIDQLLVELDAIEIDLHALLEISEIRHERWSANVVAPPYGWAPSDEAQSVARIAIDRRFTPWRERVAMLEGGATRELRDELIESLERLREMFDRSDFGWGVPASIPEAKGLVSREAARAREALRVLAGTGTGGVHVVPDTSALMRQPDLSTYGAAVGTAALTIHLVPTVLGEIDNLKDQGRIAEVREKAAKLATRIKGLRDRGKLTQGVPVAGKITAIADSRDPSFEHLPAWLDPSTPDDRILASALVLQAANPSAVVVLRRGYQHPEQGGGLRVALLRASRPVARRLALARGRVGSCLSHALGKREQGNPPCGMMSAGMDAHGEAGFSPSSELRPRGRWVRMDRETT